MRLTVLTVTGKQPAWLVTAVDEFSRRLKPRARLDIVDLKAESRSGQRPIDQLRKQEAERVLDRLPKPCRCVVLDERGEMLATRKVADRIGVWQRTGEHVAFVIGGPDGHDDLIRSRADELWSLSRLTLPHGLAKLVLLEQLYRACTLLEGHPYHRD
jgi:23S rRNA (pseudouridine1915-N3)-methyltransferase